MASNNDIIQHISTNERFKWNKNIDDLNAHVGAMGEDVHGTANGVVTGFSQYNFDETYKKKLDGIEEGALNNPHPPKHDARTEISNLDPIALSGEWSDIHNIPQAVNQVINGTYDAASICGGIKITIGSNPPASPVNNKALWFDTENNIFKIYTNNKWVTNGATYK